MSPEQTTEEKIQIAIKDVHDALLSNVNASRAVVDATLAKEKTKYTLQQAKQRLETLEKELMQL